MAIMLIGATNFALLFLLMKKRFKDFFNDIETKVAIGVILTSILIISILLIKNNVYLGAMENIRFASFQVISAISTTGLQSAFYPEIIQEWQGLSFFILIILMIIGAGSCSTGGGIKWLRIGLLFKAIVWQIKSLILPEKVVFSKKVSHFNGLTINNDILRIIGIFVFMYIIIYLISVGIVLAYYNNIPQVMFEVASAMGNVGLTSGILTPDSPDIIKIVFIVDFWLGRLENWPILLLLAMGIENLKGLFNFRRTN